MPGKDLAGSMYSLGCGQMQEMKTTVGGTPGDMYKCNIKMCNHGLRPDRRGKGGDTVLIDSCESLLVFQNRKDRLYFKAIQILEEIFE